MSLINKISSFTHQTTAEGERVDFTFTQIDSETGKVKKSNQHSNIILLDDECVNAVEVIKNKLLTAIE